MRPATTASVVIASPTPLRGLAAITSTITSSPTWSAFMNGILRTPWLSLTQRKLVMFAIAGAAASTPTARFSKTRSTRSS